MRNRKTNWKALLERAMLIRQEGIEDIISSTMSEEDMALEFDADYGRTQGIPFTVWTRNTVYFPLGYDGAESVGSVSRNPDGLPTQHQGGGC